MTGTDEHGAKIVEAAEANGTTPKEWTDRTSTRFVEVWNRLDIDYDDFIRTTEPRHYEVVQQFLQRIYDNGFIELGVLLGALLRLVRGLLHRGPARGRQVPRARPPRRRDAGGQLLLQTERVRSSRCSTTTTATPISCARSPSGTRRSVSSAAACSMSPSPGPPSRGVCRCPGTAVTCSTSGTTR